MAFAPVATVIASVTMGAVWVARYHGGVATVSLPDIATSALLPLDILLLLRCFCAVVAFSTLLSLYGNATGFVFHYQEATVLLRRHTRLTTFTVWCFTLLGVYFMLAALCSGVVLAGYGAAVPPWLVTVSLVFFEVSYPMSLLVTIVVTFVLIPTARRHNHPTERMFRWRPLMMHSGNVCLMQCAMLSAPPPVTLAHLPYAVLFGCTYAIFAWYWFRRTGVFYYYFLDYRRSGAVWTYLVLLATIALLYYLSYLTALIIRHEASRWWTYPCLLLLTLSITRFRPPSAPHQNRTEASPV